MAGLSSFGRSPLAFPAGRTPGFDPAHPAARGITAALGFSLVAAKSGFVDLLNGVPALTNAAHGTGIISNSIGPASIFTGTQNSYYNPQAASAQSLQTYAAIFLSPPTLAGGTYYFLWGCYTHPGLYLKGTSLNNYNTGDNLFGPTISTNTPYFVAWSNCATGLNWVVVNLATGATYSGASAGITLLSANSYFAVGNDLGTTNQPFTGAIAATMFAPSFMSLAALKAWAADPWSFWYPNKGTSVDSFRPIIVPPSSPPPVIITTRRRNVPRLEFPAGRAPGVDLAVNGNTIFSCIAAGGNLVNLVNGKTGVISGTIAGRILGIGLTAFETGTGAVNAVNFSGQPTALSTCTYSAIVRFNAFGNAQLNPVLATSSGLSGATLGLGNFNANQGILSVIHYNGSNFNSSYSMPLGVPHFIWASQINTSGTTFIINFVACNLATGRIYSSTISGTSTLTIANGTVQAFCLSSDPGFNGQCDIAAAAIEKAGFPLSVGLQRAADPWSFWYPSRTSVDVFPFIGSIPSLGSYLTLGGSADFQFGLGDFTIDFWANIPAFGANQQLINNGTAADWYLYLSAAGGLRWKNSSGDCCDIAISTGVHHLAVTRASGTTRVFVDGIKSAEFADTSNYGLGSDGPWVGRSP